MKKTMLAASAAIALVLSGGMAMARCARSRSGCLSWRWCCFTVGATPDPNEKKDNIHADGFLGSRGGNGRLPAF